ncbi:uncharacterized protein LOC141500529 isoform X2 [Macrotis lagotis]
MLSRPQSKGFLIDGFPRELGQAKEFERIVGRSPNIVIVFDCSTETMFHRVLLRGQKENREDDSEDIIRQRLETHYTISWQKMLQKISLPNAAPSLTVCSRARALPPHPLEAPRSKTLKLQTSLISALPTVAASWGSPRGRGEQDWGGNVSLSVYSKINNGMEHGRMPGSSGRLKYSGSKEQIRIQPWIFLLKDSTLSTSECYGFSWEARAMEILGWTEGHRNEGDKVWSSTPAPIHLQMALSLSHTKNISATCKEEHIFQSPLLGFYISYTKQHQLQNPTVTNSTQWTWGDFVLSYL